MNLITKFYRTENVERNGEILACLDSNRRSGLFEHVFAFQDDPTFGEIFERYNSVKGICILANSDIYFDESVKELEKIGDNDFVALTRYEDGILYPSYVAQDVWAFRTPVKTREDMDFHLGERGNDNRLARIMHELGYTLKNPALKVKTHHLHKSGFRPGLKTVPGPYLGVVPNDDVTKPAELIFIDQC